MRHHNPCPNIPEPCDLLHEDRRQRTKRLGEAITRALSDGGKIFIPTFALGRTQGLIYEIDRLKGSQKFNIHNQTLNIPVFIDSPLGLRITKIYSSLTEYWDKEAKELLRRGDHPIDFKNLYTVKDYKDHLKLMEIPGPAIIIAGSGMCTGGRIIDHLKNGHRRPKKRHLLRRLPGQRHPPEET